MTYEPKHQPTYTQQPPQGPATYDEPSLAPSANVPPTPRTKLQGVWLYLAILATVYVVALTPLGDLGRSCSLIFLTGGGG